MDLLVAADDRTGAFESAAVLADHGTGPVPVVAWPNRLGPDAVVGVIDIGSRHLSPSDAAGRVADLPDAIRHAHKIDSTLRGNWPTELAARAARHPVLLVPALPEFGRTCEDGIVLDHGRPITEGPAATDVRRAVGSSRPTDALLRAGVHDTHELSTNAELDDWLEAPHGVAVADAASDDDITDAVDRWRARAGDVVLAGTSAVVGAAAVVLEHRNAHPVEDLEADGPILVVCGSVHPAARRQVAFAERRGISVSSIADDIAARELERTGVLVLATEIPVGDVDEPLAVAAASALARGVHDIRRHVRIGAIVIIGGDTATAVLGSAATTVVGSAGSGVARVEAEGFDAPIVTRSGGFGADHALAELIDGLRRP